MAATPESSREALVAFLDGWIQNRTPQDFAEGSPAIIVQDDDLNRGARLLDYQIEGECRARGTGYSYSVKLTLLDTNGSQSPRKIKVAYTAVSEPKFAITRED
jgi:hypothetical protein